MPRSPRPAKSGTGSHRKHLLEPVPVHTPIRKKKHQRKRVEVESMKITKGKFKINTNQGWREYDGSYSVRFPFLLHREKTEKFWKISHLATGMFIMKVAKVQTARQNIKKLQKYGVFLMPCIDTWQKAKDRMREKEPEEYEALLEIIRGGL